MIVYTSSKRGFLGDAQANRVHLRIAEAFERRYRKRAPIVEISAWRNSMQFMATALRDADVPEDAGVSIEFGIPMSAKRVDFILTGRSEDDHEVAVIVELKQWSAVSTTDRDAMVRTHMGGGLVETVHPSYQAWTYAALIEDYNETVQSERIELRPCAYLHNLDSESAVNDPRYRQHTEKAPVFVAADVQKLQEFLGRWVRKGDRDDLMYRIEHGRIRPSKKLADALVGMLAGRPEFQLIDDQKQVFETAIALAERAASGTQDRAVLIVAGGPGTGKSVVALNLLVKLTELGLPTQYVSRNAAPRAVYKARLNGHMKRGRIDNLFRGSGAFVDAPSRSFAALIVDEAHRLTEKSGLYANLGTNQIAEIIAASSCSVFFLDQDQRVTLTDIGTIDAIREQAAQAGARVTELSLASQFRCAGSDGYLAFLDDCLQIRPTANNTLSADDYDFRVFDSPSAMHEAIRDINDGATTARMVAGYCWDWRSKRNPAAMDIELPEHDYRAQWNLTRDGSLWLITDGSVEQVGCIHTCQGLEVDYIGVIIGPDFIVRDGVVQTDAHKRSSMDRSVRGFRTRFNIDPQAAASDADRVIRNTYRTLMTRGMKGCLLFCTDAETARWFRDRIEPARVPEPNQPTPARAVTLTDFPLSAFEQRSQVAPGRAIPVYALAVAAGAFGSEQHVQTLAWAEAPDHIRVGPELFIAQVQGESMNRRIRNGAWCLFRSNPAGTLDGRILVVAHHAIHDADTGAHYTLKRYRRTSVVEASGPRIAVEVTLYPESSDDRYTPLRLDPADADELRVVAEFLQVLD